MALSVVILAGGDGTRMNSKCPKVLQKLGGQSMIEHVLDTVKKLNVAQLFIVHGHLGDQVQAALKNYPITWIEQKERLGTGHAVMQVLPYLDISHQVLILYGDVPLISAETLTHLVESTGKDQLGLLTALVENPTGLGRIVRDAYHQVSRIVEEKDATDLEKQIHEINTGIYCVSAKHLAEWLPQLKNNNKQQEYYLTDIVAFARTSHVSINVSEPRSQREIMGANSRAELARLESMYQHWQVDNLMKAGVTVSDPSRVDIRGKVTAGRDCFVDCNVIFEGEVVLGEDCIIGANVILKDVTLGRGVEIKPNSIIEETIIHEDVIIGPFARIRPDTIIQAGARVGNFVEIKKSTVGKGSKVSHLSYIGDSEVGNHVNIGAGTITCNYDGENKHKTIIEDDAFIGSNTALIAPVRIGKSATIGAGSVITEDAPEGGLTLTRAPQKTIPGWKRPESKKIKIQV